MLKHATPSAKVNVNTGQRSLKKTPHAELVSQLRDVHLALMANTANGTTTGAVNKADNSRLNSLPNDQSNDSRFDGWLHNWRQTKLRKQEHQLMNELDYREHCLVYGAVDQLVEMTQALSRSWMSRELRPKGSSGSSGGQLVDRWFLSIDDVLPAECTNGTCGRHGHTAGERLDHLVNLVLDAFYRNPDTRGLVKSDRLAVESIAGNPHGLLVTRRIG